MNERVQNKRFRDAFFQQNSTKRRLIIDNLNGLDFTDLVLVSNSRNFRGCTAQKLFEEKVFNEYTSLDDQGGLW